MKRSLFLAFGLVFFSVPAARAHGSHLWYVASPDHGQTFAYGSEAHRAWSSHGVPPHLLLFQTYTNDPYVDSSNPRQYDYFSFNFPDVKLQHDGCTFSYLSPDGRTIPVARRHPGFLGIEEIKLLPTSDLLITKFHGYLTLTLRIVD